MTFHGSPPGGRRRRPLSQDEINATGKRIRNIVGDEARTAFNDFEFNAYSDRQVARNFDIDGNVVDNRFEKFKPSAKRQDLSLDGSLGDKADNIPREVFAVKKVMSKAGAFDFLPGLEPSSEANPRFTKAIKTFQAGNDLKVDGLIRSGGPSIHMLGLKALGPEEGRPSGYDAADFRAATGRDPNRMLSGKAIFKTPGEGSGAGASRTQEASHVTTFPPAPFPPLPELPEIPKGVKKAIKRVIEGFPNIPERPQKPVIGKAPALIFRYPDGRVYIAVDERGKISPSRQGPGSITIEAIQNKHQVRGIHIANHENYPTLDNRKTFQERHAAGKESYVYGPVYDGRGNVIAHRPLVDPSTRGLFDRPRLLRAPIGKPIFLNQAQIDATGLKKWHDRPFTP